MKAGKPVEQPARRAWNSSLPAPTQEMKRTGWIERSRKPLKVRKASKRFADRRCRPFLDWLKTQPCFLTGKRTGEWCQLPYPGGWIEVVVDPAHLVRGRGAGAYDLGYALPLAHHLHDDQHQIGIKSWLAKYGLTVDGVKHLADKYVSEWRSAFPERAAEMEDGGQWR